MRTPDRMTCEEVVRRLDEYTDRQLSADDAHRVEQHLATCLQCLRAFQFEHDVIAGIRAKLQQVEVPPRLRARIVAALAD